MTHPLLQCSRKCRSWNHRGFAIGGDAGEKHPPKRRDAPRRPGVCKDSRAVSPERRRGEKNSGGGDTPRRLGWHFLQGGDSV